ARYGAWIYPEGSAGGSSVLKLLKFQSWTSFGYSNANGVAMQQVSLPGVGTNWHTVELTFQTNQITIYYDHVLVLSQTDLEVQPYVRGGINVDMWTADSPYIMSADDVVVTAPKLDQSITFAPLTNRTYGDAPVSLSAS